MTSLEDVRIVPGANCLHDSSGLPVDGTQLRRGPDRAHFPHGRPEPVDAALLAHGAIAGSIDRAVFLPHAGMGHFGHLLTEFAAHAGALLEDGEGIDGVAGPGSCVVLPARAAASAGAVGRFLRLPPERVACAAAIPGPLRIGHALVPLPTMVNRHGLSVRHFDRVRLVLARAFGIDALLDRLGEGDRGEKLYLSRSRLPAGARRVDGEPELEEALVRAGWCVSHPEQVPMGRQVESLLRARTIAGCIGSALHLLMAFGREVGRRRLVALGPAPEACNTNVALQAVRQGLPFRHLVCVEPDEASPGGMRFTVPARRIAERLEQLAQDEAW